MGLIELSGTLRNITWVNSKYGNYPRRKSSLTRERFNTDPAFAGTRKASNDFGRRNSSGMHIRLTLRTMLKECNDKKHVKNFTRKLFEIQQSDKENATGFKDLLKGDAGILKNFSFNGSARTYGNIFNCSIDPLTCLATSATAIKAPDLINNYKQYIYFNVAHGLAVIYPDEPQENSLYLQQDILTFEENEVIHYDSVIEFDSPEKPVLLLQLMLTGGMYAKGDDFIITGNQQDKQLVIVNALVLGG